MHHFCCAAGTCKCPAVSCSISSTLMPPVAIFTGRWGSWPGWMPLVLKSLSHNTWAHFILLSEAPPRALLPANVIFHNLSIESLEFKMREKVGLNVNLSVRDTSANGEATGMSTAKTNDLKPMWGEVFADSLLRGYEWWGYLQEDVLLGDVTVCISPYVFPMNTRGVSCCFVTGRPSTWRGVSRPTRLTCSP